MSYELYEGEMAEIFDKMYQIFINYEEEYSFYNNLLFKYGSTSVLEIGCGTGNLAKKFITNSNIDYQGLDYSFDMIKIATERNQKNFFFLGDMRDFKLNNMVDSIIMTGRTSSYIITNSDLFKTLNTIKNNLTINGYFIFDFIDASRYIPYILTNHNIRHEAKIQNITYSRIANWHPTDNDNLLLKWEADYYRESNGHKTIIKKDISIVRVFTLDELKLYLSMNGFETVEIIDRKTYAYDTFVIVAKKQTVS